MRRAILLAVPLLLLPVHLRADVKSGEKALHEALRKPGATEGVEKACDELIVAGGKEAISAILKLLPKVKPESATDYYWQLVGGASGFKDRAALEELGRFVIANPKSAIAKDLVFGLQNNGSNYVSVPLGLVLEKGSYDLQLLAVDQLANVRTADSVDSLVLALKRESGDKGDKELRRRALRALELITGEDQGAENWEGWWKEQRSKGLPERKASAGGATTRSRDLDELKTQEDPKAILVVTNDRSKMDRSKGEPRAPFDFDFDHMQAVLDRMKIKHTVVFKDELEADPEGMLRTACAVLINCSRIETSCICPTCVGGGATEGRTVGCQNCGKHDIYDPRFKDATVKALKAWVEKGGSLFTEDLGLVDVIDRAWPDMISSLPPQGGAKVRAFYVKAATVKLAPGQGSTTNPLMRGVWQRPRNEGDGPQKSAGDGKTVERSPAKPLEHRWKIDDESPAFKVVDEKQVTVLLMSEELGKLAQGHTGVAVTFRPGASKKQATGGGSRGTGEWAVGGGRVLHTMSHFGKQDTSQDGKALENLILNFLLEARRQLDAPGKK